MKQFLIKLVIAVIIVAPSVNMYLKVCNENTEQTYKEMAIGK